MNTRVLPAAAVATLVISSGAMAATIDILSAPTDGIVPIILFTTEAPESGALLNIEWDLTYTALGLSWGSELTMALVHESGYMVTFDGSDDNDIVPDDIDFGWGHGPGTYTSSGTAVAGVDIGDLVDASGMWSLAIIDEYDDDGIDGMLDGSVTVNAVPAPGALAMLGLAGLVGCGRRRR